MKFREGGVLFNNNMDDFYHAPTDEIYLLDTDFQKFNREYSKSDPTIFLKVSSVLFVRAGLFLSQVSSIPSSNIQVLIFQNIIDIATNTVIYSIFGHVLAYGTDVGKFLGFYGFLNDETNKNDLVEGWLIIIAISGLLIAAIGDRISFFSSVILNVLISGLVFPIIIHWTLSEYGWMKNISLGKVKVSYKDYSYSSMIHMSGGFLAFLGMIILNKRLLRFKDMDVSSIPDNGPSLTLFGNFFMIIGFFGIGVPSEQYFLRHLDNDFYGIVITNMLVSAFGAATSTLLLTFSCPCEPMHKWTSMRSIQAGIAGIAVIAGGADVLFPMASLMIGIASGFLFFLVSFLVSRSPTEDYSNIIACHFVSGLVGTLLPPLFGVREGFNAPAGYRCIHFLWQLICDVTILSVIAAIFAPILFALDACSVLRSWDEDINHRRALYASKNVNKEEDSSGANGWRNQSQNVSYLEPGYKTKEKNSRGDIPEVAHEPVDVLFEKRQTTNKFKQPMTKSEEIEATEKYEEYFPKGSFENHEFVVNYMVNSKPLTFFEDLSDSRQTSETVMKECGDNLNRSLKILDVKFVKGLRNISDSKLFQKFKENWTVPKKRVMWNKERTLRFGSMSNIWAPSAARISMETQV